MKTRILVALVSLLLAVSAFAAGNPNLKPLEGNWTCTGIAFATNMGPEHPTKATVKAPWILDDKWLRVDYKEEKTAKNPHPIEAMLLMTFDEGKKRVASGTIDNAGGYGTQESGDPAWDGDVMTLVGTGRFGNQDVKLRDTFTKGKNSIKHLGEIAGGDGKWTKLDEETCKK